MKKIIFAVLMCVGAFSAFAQSRNSITPGTVLPSATQKLTTVDGKTTTLNAITKSNGLLVMFSCNTCPYVIRNQQRIHEICKYALQNNIGVVVLNSNEAQRESADSYEAMQEYAKSQEYQWIYAVDEKSTIADALGATRTPEVFLFDKNKKLQYKGAIDDSPTNANEVKQMYLKNAIDAIVEGTDVIIKESKSVGCSIKRLATR